jgi:hypothetical protein
MIADLTVASRQQPGASITPQVALSARVLRLTHLVAAGDTLQVTATNKILDYPIHVGQVIEY